MTTLATVNSPQPTSSLHHLIPHNQIITSTHLNPSYHLTPPDHLLLYQLPCKYSAIPPCTPCPRPPYLLYYTIKSPILQQYSLSDSILAPTLNQQSSYASPMFPPQLSSCSHFT